jgi:hypothetical protein
VVSKNGLRRRAVAPHALLQSLYEVRPVYVHYEACIKQVWACGFKEEVVLKQASGGAASWRRTLCTRVVGSIPMNH